ncbi:Probable acetyl-CoA acyltransferase [uncultured Clostridium sp.]|uniref:thiolase family protein n=1 Tax=uncultured Clostridium sp. TaxID=59620 RepID=UPI0008216447|nr:thiolase family protein [uncultured Clostridium sp.]SCJ97497.1 Probable acetyl-CoA acyltransferase [uncultured Clostridium sp.]
MNNVYILGGLRSPIGVTNGIFKEILIEDLTSNVIKDVVDKFKLKDIEEIILGNSVGGGGNIARLCSLNSNLNVPAYTIDMQCASALESIAIGYSKIVAGLKDLILVGGVESTSMEPIRSYSKNHPKYSKDNNEYKVAKFSPNNYDEHAMIKGAERVTEKYGFTKDDLDKYAICSHKKAINARDSKVFNDIISPINRVIDDEGIRVNVNERLLSKVKPILGKGNKITAGNSCLTHDGAAILALCSERYLKDNNIKGSFKIIDFSEVAENPDYSPEAVLYSINKLLKSNKLTSNDISSFEVNEAFTVITALINKKYSINERLNIFGGALAYGHPYGASGGIITLHLLKALEVVKGRYGIAAIASAGGLGVSMLIERI